jgi:hypothetical protein
MEEPISPSSIERMVNSKRSSITRAVLRVQRKQNFKSKPRPEAAWTNKLKYVRVQPETP